MSRLCKNRMPPKTGVIAAILTHKPMTTEQYNLIATCHNAIVGHGGVQRTLRNLKKTNKVWLGMRDAVKTIITNRPCRQKMSAMKYPIIAYRYTTSTYKLMKCLNIDFIGTFPDKGYILVMIDTFLRFIELYATPDATAKLACTALVEHVGRYGSPCILRSDNGPHFARLIIDEFVKIVGTTHN